MKDPTMEPERLTLDHIMARPIVLKLERPIVARIATITDWPLILIDLYLNHQMPKSAESIQFFTTIRSKLTPRGTAVFNRLVLSGQNNQAKQFKSKLENTFDHIQKIPTTTNWLLQVS